VEDAPAETAPEEVVEVDFPVEEPELAEELRLSPTEDEDIFRPTAPVPSQEVPAPASDQVSAERERLAAERAARRQAREAALAPVVESAPEVLAAADLGAVAVPAAPEPVVVVRRTTDRFAGSLALFLMRLVLAAVLGVRGINGILTPQLASSPWEGNLLPQPQLVGLVLSAASVGLAILLVFGMFTRLAGFGVAGIAILTLVFVKWGSFSPFLPDQLGIVGEFELLLAASGLVLLFLGSGAWAVDYGFRRRREQDRDPRRVA
jgi:uncharacterized membrane protein YphA (DoxX/SURF4 family)